MFIKMYAWINNMTIGIIYNRTLSNLSLCSCKSSLSFLGCFNISFLGGLLGNWLNVISLLMIKLLLKILLIGLLMLVLEVVLVLHLMWWSKTLLLMLSGKWTCILWTISLSLKTMSFMLMLVLMVIIFITVAMIWMVHWYRSSHWKRGKWPLHCWSLILCLSSISLVLMKVIVWRL